MTLYQKLSTLANPRAGFIERIRVIENSADGLTFANGWVASPPAVANSGLTNLSHMPVSGYGEGQEAALNRLMMEAVERNSSVYLGLEESAAAHSLLSWQEHTIHPAYIYLGYASIDENENVITDSNGCAAGETLEAAIYRGLLEVIERDALAIWWSNRLSLPGLKFGDQTILCSINASLAREGRSFTLLTLTHDIGIPVVAALTADLKGGHIYIGAAADICQRRAAERAACEMFQFWLWGRISVNPSERIAWLRNESFETQPWLKPQNLSFSAKNTLIGRISQGLSKG